VCSYSSIKVSVRLLINFVLLLLLFIYIYIYIWSQFCVALVAINHVSPFPYHDRLVIFHIC
jgi:hypothetical protein